MKNITIIDIAKLSGVSKSTVSRVLNNNGSVSEESRAKVNKAIEELNYVPNKSAQNLKKNLNKSVALMIKGMSNPFFTQMLTIIQYELNKTGFSTEVHQVNVNGNEIDEAVALAKEKKVSGIIFLGGNYDRTSSEIKKLNIPFIFVTFDNRFGDCPIDGYSSICINDEESAYIGTEYLINKGHRKIVFLGIDLNDRSISGLRYMGYLRALRDNGLEVDLEMSISTKSLSFRTAYNAVVDLLKSETDFTSIFAVSDIFAISACRALMDNGYKVPADVSVLGFDGIDYAKFYNPIITTIAQPIDKMAKKSVEIIVSLIKSELQNVHIVCDSEIFEGNSCHLYKQEVIL